MFVKNNNEILIGIVQNLYDAFGSRDIFTLSSLLIQIASHLFESSSISSANIL